MICMCLLNLIFYSTALCLLSRKINVGIRKKMNKWNEDSENLKVF